MTSRIRSEIIFPIIQTPNQSHYAPGKTKDKALLALFEGRPGTRIPVQQHIGLRALSQVYEAAKSDDDDDSLDSLRHISEFTAAIAIGTAHHAFEQREPGSPKVMYTRDKLPSMVSPNGEQFTSREELIEEASSGLKYAESLAEEIRSLRTAELPAGRVNERLARSLTRTSLRLAVIASDVPEQRDTRINMQDAAHDAAMAAYQKTIGLTHIVGERPTAAALADSESELRRQMHDDNNNQIIEDWFYSDLTARITSIIKSDA